MYNLYVIAVMSGGNPYRTKPKSHETKKKNWPLWCGNNSCSMSEFLPLGDFTELMRQDSDVVNIITPLQYLINNQLVTTSPT